ncbi:MAG TPA: glycosyltransferase family 2 protein, partial [Cytophagaceae bacterium]|nr:glycosyltransferase family 2 protein [Cytophagaceae bacterium]
NYEICLILVDSFGESILAELKNDSKTRSVKMTIVHIDNSQNSSIADEKIMSSVSGEYCAFINAGDILAVTALFEIAKHLNSFPKTDIVYTNEEKKSDHSLSLSSKPYWSPDTLLSYNYIEDLTIFRTRLVIENDAFHYPFEETEKYDLLLRLTEKTSSISHIPKVLFRKQNTKSLKETSEYKYISEKEAIISSALMRRGEESQIMFYKEEEHLTNRILYKTGENKKVSIIIPTKDSLSLIKQCIESIFDQSTYSNYEVIIIDNNSVEKDFLEYMVVCKEKYSDRFFCYPYKKSFNFSAINNFGVTKSNGEYIILLNNDTKVISPDWIESLMQQAQRKSIGVVGALLLYPDGSIQHAGIDFDIHGLPFHIYAGEEKESVNYAANFPALTAACIMFRKELHTKVMGLDEMLAVEFNDVDFCLKIKKAGYHNIFLPYVELYHYESFSRGSSHSTAEKYETHLKEKNIFISRWSDYIKEMIRLYNND